MIDSTDGLYMNRALILWAVMKMAAVLGVASACVSACGFKGAVGHAAGASAGRATENRWRHAYRAGGCVGHGR